MKFYNPFKPHIVTDGEKYAIRKLTTIGWFRLHIIPCRYSPDEFLHTWWITEVPQYTHDKSLTYVKECLRKYKALSKSERRIDPKEWRVDTKTSQSESDTKTSQLKE